MLVNKPSAKLFQWVYKRATVLLANVCTLCNWQRGNLYSVGLTNKSARYLSSLALYLKRSLRLAGKREV